MTRKIVEPKTTVKNEIRIELKDLPKTEDGQIDYSSMTNEQILARLRDVEAAHEKLKSAKTTKVKDQVLQLIKDGHNTIQSIANELSTTTKNISSNLTYLRADLVAENKTIVSQRMGDNTMLAIMDIETLGWDKVR